MTTSACPPPELVQASQEGVLPPDLQARVSQHVAECPMCQALNEALDAPDVGAMTPDENQRILARVHAGIAVTRRPLFTSGRLSALAAAAAVVVAVVWFRANNGAVVPPALQLDRPLLSSGADAANDLIWRGPGYADAATQLDRALEPFRANAFADAERQLATLTASHPRFAPGHFYLGVARLFIDRDAGAITALEAAQSLAAADPALARECAWYLAMAYARTGQHDRAAQQLESLCRGTSARSAQACVALGQLSTESSPARSR